MPQPSEREIEIFNAALELPAAERAAYLGQVCAGDAALRQRVEELLQASGHAGGFLEGTTESPPGPGGTIRLSLSPIEKPGDRIGRYKLLQQIGEGGCGIVYMAEQVEPVQRRVALKVIKLGMDTKEVIGRFEAERQALAMMDHPNIAKVLDAGATHTGRPYFVMELVRGIKITDYCDQNNLSAHERLELFTQICRAIQHAHQKGIIHRDIKPSNILVTMHDGTPVPKVIDFGIAKATHGKLTNQTVFTAFEQFIGTPAYMSPEQAEMSALDIDTRSDIYSLGVLLYELLTGRTPFDAKELVQAGLDEIRRTIREQEPARPSTCLSTMLGSDLTAIAKHRKIEPPALISMMRGDLDWIVMKALEKDRTRRYETANGLALDIQRHLSNEPVVARPPSNFYRFEKLVRRNKLGFIAASAVTVALLFGMVVSTWQAVRATRAEREQNRLRDRAESAQRDEEQQRRRAELQAKAATDNAYSANMLLARAEWEENHPGHVRQILEQTSTYRDRGFEWYYWQRMCHLDRFTLRGHTGPVTAVGYSPDGRRILTGSQDQTARIWDASNGKLLQTLRDCPTAPRSVALSPDGQRIAVGLGDGRVRICEAASGQELLMFVADAPRSKGDLNFIGKVAFSPDGKELATEGWYSAKVWEVTTGRELDVIGNDFERGSATNGGHFLSWGSDGSVKSSTARPRPMWQSFGDGRPHMLLPFALSPDGRHFLYCNGGTGRSVEPDPEAVIRLEESGLEQETVEAAAFSPVGSRIVTGGAAGLVKVWDAASGRRLLTFQGHSASADAVTFSPDGRQILSGSDDATAKVWDIDASSPPLCIRADAHDNQVDGLAISPNGKCLAGAPLDTNTITLWDSASGKVLRVLIPRQKATNWQAMISSLSYSADGRHLAGGGTGTDHQVRIWDMQRFEEVQALRGHTADVEAVAFSPDGGRVASASDDQTVKVWDWALGRDMVTFREHAAPVLSVAISPQGTRIVSGDRRGVMKLWDSADAQVVWSVEGHGAAVNSLAYSPDGQRIASGSDDGTVKLWDAATGRKFLTCNASGKVTSIAFCDGGNRVASATDDPARIHPVIQIWNASDGHELLTLKPNRSIGVFTSLAASADSTRIAAGCFGWLFVWEAASPEQVTAWQAAEMVVR